MSITKWLPETHWSWSEESQSEIYQNLPGDNNVSLLPLTNGSIDVYIDLKKFREVSPFYHLSTSLPLFQHCFLA